MKESHALLFISSGASCGPKGLPLCTHSSTDACFAQPKLAIQDEADVHIFVLSWNKLGDATIQNSLLMLVLKSTFSPLPEEDQG